MAQWQEVQQLPPAHLERVHQLYTTTALPMTVRQSLADWIEDQDWYGGHHGGEEDTHGAGGGLRGAGTEWSRRQQAAEPFSSHARMLFHSLLALLGEHLGSLGPGDEDFMLKHNLRKARIDLQAAFEEQPENLANLVANLLQEERRILRRAQAKGQVEAPPAPSVAPQSSREQEIQQRLAEFRTALQEAERAFRHLEDMQDAFDFSYKMYCQTGQDHSRDPEYLQQVQALQAKLQSLDRQRREVVAQLQQLLGRSETLRDFLQQELSAWRERQQRSCLGAPADTCLLQLQGWFTALGEGLFQLLQLRRGVGELRQKVTYSQDPLQTELPLLEKRLQEQLTCLLQSAFVVEQQPCMPNTPKRPLVLRTTNKFCTRARLLVHLYDRNHRMEANIHIDRSGGTHRRHEGERLSTSGGGRNRASGKGGGPSVPRGVSGPLAVTEELHLITFTLAYAYCGLELKLETSTLPFVIVSNNNQLSSAWASVLWFNMLSPNPKASSPYAVPTTPRPHTPS
ncbi:hypothetical protein ASZ78_004028 [Callipepla squamata]|uniref:STAT transcription factor protein interaction domain-containing protein n=1 Tax=Callipepla squamata TaxID=9009 RepID=A0A226MEH4_CALSU|nr:hypothetical protein ASZ78_004028 [Callipepla squamata]